MLIVRPATPVGVIVIDCDPTTGPSPEAGLNWPFTTRLIATAPNPDANFSVKLPLASVVAAQGPEVRMRQWWPAPVPFACTTRPVIGASLAWIAEMLFAGQPASPAASVGDGEGLGEGDGLGVGDGVGVGLGVAGAGVAGAWVAGASVGASVGVAVGDGAAALAAAAVGVALGLGAAVVGAAVAGACVGAVVAVGCCALNAVNVAWAWAVSSVLRQRASVPTLSAAAWGVRPSFATASFTAWILSALQSCGLSFAKLEVHAVPISRRAAAAAKTRFIFEPLSHSIATSVTARGEF